MYRARSTPYGDIYTIPTTTVDNIANRFVLEQKQRQAQQASESKALDDMFGKNISGMRDEDIPEYTQAYQDYKQAKIGLLNNNKLSGNARIQAELDAQGKLAKTFQILNNSKETQKGLLDIKKRVDNKPDDHVDDAFAMVGAANGIPSSQLHTLTRPDPNGEIDPSTGKIKIVPYDATDYNNYLDRGNVKDWEQVAKTSLGDYKDIDPIKEDYKDKSGLVLGQTVTPIKSTISPTAYMANMSKYIYSGVGRMKHYTNTFKQIYTDDKAQQIASEYYDNAKNNPLWKQAWGENGLAIPPEALLNPNTRYLALNAMENAINYPPKLGKPSNVPNPVNVAQSKEDLWMKHNNIKQQQSLEKIRLNNEGRRYEIDNIPLKLNKDKKSVPIIVDGRKVEQDVIDVTDYPTAEKNDIRGSKVDKYGEPVNNFIIINGREYVKPNEDGSFTIDNGVNVTPKDIIINTNKRTQGWEKPSGTGKAAIRGNETKPTVKKGKYD